MKSKNEIAEQLQLHLEHLEWLKKQAHPTPDTTIGQRRYDRSLRLSTESIILALQWVLELEDSL